MRVLAATGLLAEFGEAGVLAAADVHVARRLGHLAREADERVLLAAALAVRAVRLGATCLELDRMREVHLDPDPDPAPDPDPDPDSAPSPAVGGVAHAVDAAPGSGPASGVDVAALPWPPLPEVIDALRRSPLVVGSSAGALRPLRLVDTDGGPLLYLVRYWQQEQTVRRQLDDRARERPPYELDEVRAALAALFPDTAAPDRQRVAVALAATRWTTVLAGGPGTGKTTTVARVLALLLRLDPSLRVALAAPTGKAAARLQESVRAQAAALDLPEHLTARTLHRLLGWRPDSATRFRHDARNRLPYDLVVVDESSMVSLTLMARLLEALRPDARLLLVGDPDQLTSVDAGAVLADLVARPVSGPPDPALAGLVGDDLTAGDDVHESGLSAGERQRLAAGVVRLSRGRRFGGAIARLAVAVREGDADEAVGLLRSDASDVELVDEDDLDGVRDDVVRSAAEVTAAAAAGDVAGALALLEGHRLLCAHRHGPYGVGRWDRSALEWAVAAGAVEVDPAGWYAGQPLLVTRNDHDAQIYNGDTGVVVAPKGGNSAGRLVAAFSLGREPVLLPLGRLADVRTVHAMTIHRSQGSQDARVSVVLPATASTLLTRELLYTAITRAREHVRLVGDEQSLRAGIGRQVLRASGLRRVLDPRGG